MQRTFEFKLKKVTEAGEFEGLAAVYGNVDLGQDRILPGSFTRTLASSKVRPLLKGHGTSDDIGTVLLSDSPIGLVASGKLNLEKQNARDMHSDLKFYQAQGLSYGMSIGYETLQSKQNGDVRDLSELRLWECSLTLFPMNPQATVTSVKSFDQFAKAIDRHIQESKTWKPGF